MKPEEIEAKLKEFSMAIDTQKKTFEIQMDTMKKDFELKLESAQREADSWKANAQKREDEIKKYQEEATKAKKDAEEALAKSREQENKAFAERLKREGRITAAQEEQVIKLMESLISSDAVATFKEKDGSTRSHTQLSLFKQLLSSLPVRVNYSESTYGVPPAAETPEIDGGEKAAQFMEVITKNGGKQTLPVQGVEIAEAAEKYMEEKRKAGIVVSYADALIAVSPRKRVSA